MSSSVECPVCENTKAKLVDQTAGGCEINCPRCGQYRITASAEATIRTRGRRYILSAWIREQTNFGDTSSISSYNIDEISNRRQPPFVELLDRLLVRCVEKSGEWGG